MKEYLQLCRKHTHPEVEHGQRENDADAGAYTPNSIQVCVAHRTDNNEKYTSCKDPTKLGHRSQCQRCTSSVGIKTNTED